jgi:GxxExxY protein
MKFFDLTPEIINAAVTIHRKLGPGLLESAYEACLAYELQRSGMRVERQNLFRCSMTQSNSTADSERIW